MQRFRRNVLAGLLTIVPLWITGLGHVVRARPDHSGRAPARPHPGRALRPHSDDLADLLVRGWFQSLLAVAIVVVLLFTIGAATNAVLGRRLLRFVDRLMKRVPLAKTVYGATRTLIDSVQGGPQGAQRVVLIEFPTPEMRAVGFVTATFRASDTDEELAAVYVPTTPNPTCRDRPDQAARLARLDRERSDVLHRLGRCHDTERHPDEPRSTIGARHDLIKLSAIPGCSRRVQVLPKDGISPFPQHWPV
jgi:uncharacterized membrane protein